MWARVGFKIAEWPSMWTALWQLGTQRALQGTCGSGMAPSDLALNSYTNSTLLGAGRWAGPTSTQRGWEWPIRPTHRSSRWWESKGAVSTGRRWSRKGWRPAAWGSLAHPALEPDSLLAEQGALGIRWDLGPPEGSGGLEGSRAGSGGSEGSEWGQGVVGCRWLVRR